jgi:hypothetical protein
MKLGPTIVGVLLAATSTVAQGQNDSSATKSAAPNEVDAQKIVGSIIKDKSKIKAYCEVAKLYEQIADAQAKNDMKAVQALSLKVQAQMDTLGSDYAQLQDRFDQTGPDTAEGKKISAALDRLDQQCR